MYRAWHAGVRPKTEDAAVRRVAERNALRCSLLRSEARKKQQPKVSLNIFHINNLSLLHISSN